MRRLTVLLLGIQALLTIFVIIRNLAGYPEIPLLTILTTLFAFSFACLHAGLEIGWKRAGLLIAFTILIALSLESLGVATGMIYGPYEYTDRLGPKFLDLVPYVISLAWYMMLYPSLVIAMRIAPVLSTWRWRFLLAAVGALVMTSWDLVMDPLMVSADHWIWKFEGDFFGIPLQNYWGWWLTAFTIITLWLVFGRIRSQTRLMGESNQFNRLAILSYAVTGISSAILAYQNGLGGPALAGLMAMTPWILIGWQRDPTTPK